MKMLIAIFFIIISVITKAQNTDPANGYITNGIIIEQSQQKLKMFKSIDSNYVADTPLKKLSAGDELIKASKLYYTGVVIASIGVLGMSVGSYVYGATANADIDKQRTIVYVGAGITFVGMIVNLTAFSHISKAGQKLNMISGKDGLGISMKF